MRSFGWQKTYKWEPICCRRGNTGMKLLCSVVVLALLAASCSGGDAMEMSMGDYPVAPAPPLPDAVPTVEFDPTSQIADADGSVVVSLTRGEVRFATAQRADAVPIGAGGELRAVSAAGDRAAVFEHHDGQSVITVVEADPGVSPKTFELPGLVEPEAFSTDGELLFVIDHQVSRTPGAYRVRPLDLASGRLQTITGPTKVPLVDDMNGTGRRQVWTPGGGRLNTLYIRQTHHHHGPDEVSADEHSDHGHGEPGSDGFVHILDLDQEWAHCLDLPASFGAGELATTALAVSPDGALLAVADLTAGEVALASAEELRVTQVFPLPERVLEMADGDLHIGLTNGAIVFGRGTQAAWFDLATMAPLGGLVDLGAELSGFTPGEESVLAWLAPSSGPPRQLTPRR